MVDGQTCSICGKGKLKILHQTDNCVQYSCDTCGGYHASVQSVIGIKTPSVRLHARSSGVVNRQPPKIGTDPIKEVIHIIKESSQVRYVRDRTNNKTKVFQTAYSNDREYKHIHCKNCDNEWNLGDQPSYEQYFRIDGKVIQCLNCGEEASLTV